MINDIIFYSELFFIGYNVRWLLDAAIANQPKAFRKALIYLITMIILAILNRTVTNG